VTSATDPTDWAVRNAESAVVNGRTFTPDEVCTFLAEQRSGVSQIVLAHSGVLQTFELEFFLAQHDDLQAVDDALDRLIAGGELSHRSIDDLIMRGKRHPTAGKYLHGITNYLYGVLAREGSVESQLAGGPSDARYQGRYDAAVEILGRFDRRPAQAVCGIVAFHYNQFSRAATKTRSERVADIALRFRAMLEGKPWADGGAWASQHAGLDRALSDSVIEQVLSLCAIPLDGSADAEVSHLVSVVGRHRPSDAFKLRLIAAEHYLAAGDAALARRYADALRHGRLADAWYPDFISRAAGSTRT
jgi:hypothetical protein